MLHLVTRRDLVEYGATKYQSVLVTKTVQPYLERGRKGFYYIGELTAAIGELLLNSRMKAKTRQALEVIRQKLAELRDAFNDCRQVPLKLENMDDVEGFMQEWTVVHRSRLRATAICNHSTKRLNYPELTTAEKPGLYSVE